ncbi:MAG: tetratricopeptide repeat protein [Chromatiales bacterium]|nr:tetratricopeptide repeat protein [Chromatiales bacterium]
MELHLGRLDDASQSFTQALHARVQKSNESVRPAPSWQIGELMHWRDQLEFLDSINKLPSEYLEGSQQIVTLLAALGPGVAPTTSVRFDTESAQVIARLTDSLVRYAPPPRQAGNTLNASIDFAEVEKSYFAGALSLQVIDNLLSESCLAAMNKFLVESTIWKVPYEGEYMGTFVENGVFAPLVAQLAQDLQSAMPNVLGMHSLRKVWAFKYLPDAPGIGLHGDDAAVSVNLWITPDAARMPQSDGGLLFWDTPAPADWDFAAINHSDSKRLMEDYLHDSGASTVAVPYQANRAALFCSDLFHEGTSVAFRDSYECRRINLTFLFGYRRVKPAASTQPTTLAQAIELHRGGDLATARAAYADALKREPDNAQASHLLAQLELRDGNIGAAKELVLSALSLAPSAPDFLVTLAEITLAEGDANEAASILSDLESRATLSAQGYRLRAQLLFDGGHPGEAVGTLKRACEKFPKDSLMQRAIGIVLQAQGQLDEALTALQTATELAPDDALCTIALASALDANGDFQGAHDILGHVLTADADNADAHTLSAGTALQCGDYDGSWHHAARARQLVDATVSWFSAVALEARHLGSSTDPAAVEAHITCHGVDYARLIGLGNAQRQCGDLESARDSYERAVAADSTQPHAYRRLGTVLGLLGDGSRATEAFNASRGSAQEADEAPIEDVISLDAGFLSDELDFEHIADPDGDRYPWAMASTELTILTSCDRRYFQRFARPLIVSMIDNAHVPMCFHFHVVNPDDSVDILLTALRSEFPTINILHSIEQADVSALAPEKTYYACARFLRFMEVAKTTPGAVLVMDMDILCLRALTDILGELDRCRSDIGIFTLQPPTFDLWDHYQAGAVFVAPTAKAHQVMRNCAAYIQHFLSRRLPRWYLDQVGLFAALNYDSGTEHGPIVTELRHDWLAVPSGDKAGNHGASPGASAVFWSLGSSHPANAALESHVLAAPYFS